jgi:fatty acid desaturase
MHLRYLADLRTIAFVIFYFTLVAVQWTVPQLSVFGPTPWIGAALLVLTFIFSFFCAVATHNTVHAPVFRERHWNRVFQVILSLTYGHMVSAFVPGHNLSHHKHTQTNRDVMRTTKVRFGWNLLNVLFFLIAVAPSIVKGEGAYFKAMKEKHPAWVRQLRIEQFVLYGLYVLLAYLDWQKFLVLVFIPHKYAAWGIVTINVLQHDGCDQDHPYNHARNFVGKFVNWFTFNNGFHTIHHVTPGLHWSLAPEVHARTIAPFIHPNLDQKSMFLYIVKTYVWPGKRENYDGTPMVLPPAAPDEAWIPQPEETPDDLGVMTPTTA